MQTLNFNLKIAGSHVDVPLYNMQSTITANMYCSTPSSPTKVNVQSSMYLANVVLFYIVD